MAYITHYYTPDEIKIIVRDLKANVPVKRIARLRGIDFNRKGDGMLKKIRQIKRALEKGFTIEDILKKKTTETYNKKSEPMKELKFYSVEEINIMKTDIATGQPIKQIARRLAKEFSRPAPGLEQKLYGLKKTVPYIAKWNGPRLKKTPVKRIINKWQQSKHEPIVQQPAEVGVEVPHGMTFEGKPKRIMLHSDHFRIYF
jgi:DNA-binding transcriptional MerR regulator